MAGVWHSSLLVIIKRKEFLEYFQAFRWSVPMERSDLCYEMRRQLMQFKFIKHKSSISSFNDTKRGEYNVSINPLRKLNEGSSSLRFCPLHLHPSPHVPSSALSLFLRMFYFDLLHYPSPHHPTPSHPPKMLTSELDVRLEWQLQPPEAPSLNDLKEGLWSGGWGLDLICAAVTEVKPFSYDTFPSHSRNIYEREA